MTWHSNGVLFVMICNISIVRKKVHLFISTAFQIRHHQNIGLAGDGRMNAFGVGG